MGRWLWKGHFLVAHWGGRLGGGIDGAPADVFRNASDHALLGYELLSFLSSKKEKGPGCGQIWVAGYRLVPA